jgi:hypothetical protein
LAIVRSASLAAIAVTCVVVASLQPAFAANTASPPAADASSTTLSAKSGAAPAESIASQQAEREQQVASLAAANAKAAGDRAVSAELGRLSDLEAQYAAREQILSGGPAAIAARRAMVEAWRSRERGAEASASTADETYVALRGALRVARSDLAAALDRLRTGTSDIPKVNPDGLANLPADVDARQVRAKQAALQARRKTLFATTRAADLSEAGDLLNAVSTLNEDRLTLLPYLSSAKRAAVTGFGAAGLDQASAEIRQLVLIGGFHLLIATQWLSAALRAPGPSILQALVKSAGILIAWVLLWSIFLWWRRRSPRLFASWQQRLEDADRKALRATPGPALRLVRFLRAIRRPLESLALYFALIAVLPPSLLNLLEARLIDLAVLWALGGSVTVAVINAGLADSVAKRFGLAPSEDETGRLRLKSLKLVGGVTVGYALTLCFTVQLVGQGTIFRWVAATAWVAAIGTAGLLAQWWKPFLFRWAETHRRNSVFHQWALADQTGGRGLVAALLVAVEYFAIAASRLSHRWLGSLDFVRRGSVYLFRREMSRREAQPSHETRLWIDGVVFDTLGPDIESTAWISTPASTQFQSLLARPEGATPRALALIGERGAGKTATLRHLASTITGAVLVDCAAEDSVEICLARVGAAASAQSQSAPPLILLDNVQALIKPVMGGLRRFDELMSILLGARAGSRWCLAIDAAVWPFLEASRGSGPLFDEVIHIGNWPETLIAELLTMRCAQAGVEPTYEDFLDAIPTDADAVEREVALAAKRRAYALLVWDYSRGNPGLALEVWRRSLATDGIGQTYVRPLRTPAEDELDALADEPLLVLRSVLQLRPTSAAEIETATRLSTRQVAEALRFFLTRGILIQQDGRISDAWTWRRAIAWKLERRHLMFGQ